MPSYGESEDLGEMDTEPGGLFRFLSAPFAPMLEKGSI
jgi:hypothetical protein